MGVINRNKAKNHVDDTVSKLPVYTWKDMDDHRTLDSCWVVVNGFVYDVTEFVPNHPGGKYALSTAAGQDITYLMQTSHPFTQTPYKILAKYKIGRIDEFVTYTKEQPFYDEIKQKVKTYFEKTKLDPKDATFTFNVFFGVLTIFLFSFYNFLHGAVWGALLVGVCRALFGIHTMHACSHFSVTHNPIVWKYLNWFCFDILMGSSHWAWDYQHVVGHHQHTNVFNADPDLPVVKDGDMRYVVEGKQKYKWYYKYQHYYLPILYTALAVKVHVYDVMYLLGLVKNGNITMNQSAEKYAALFATKLFWLFYNFYVPLVYFNQSIGQFLFLFLCMELSAGTWLAYTFQVNHISTNVLYTDQMDKSSTTEKEWAQIQVEGSVDYAHNSMLHMLATGTLNYQVIHHLFPSIAPHHYPAIAPLVQESCKKFGIKYQCHDNYFLAAVEHIKELKRMGELGIQAPVDFDGF